MDLDLSKVCRLCLKGGEVMCPIFGSSQLNGNSASLPHRIMSCAQVKVFEGDGLPTNVCTSCLSQVDKSYQFKLLCERSDTTLRGNLHGRNSASDSESLDGGDSWDMTKFTPEVIINEGGDENNVETNGGLVEGEGYYPLSEVEAILRHHGTEIKMQQGAAQILVPLSNGGVASFEGFPAQGAPIIHQSSVSGQTIVHQQALVELPAPGPSPKSRRCRGGDKLFKCRQCNKSYSFSSALSRHKAVHNTALRPHVCNICNKGFTQLDKLLRHQKTHSLDVGMNCDLCLRAFKTFAAYQKHRMLGNCHEGGGGSVHCEKCNADVYPGEAHQCTRIGTTGGGVAGVVVKEEVLVKVKPEIREDEKPVQLTTTNRATEGSQPVGGQTTTPPVSVPPPRSSSKGKPEFKCEVCQKNFATRGSLDVHSTIHTGLRPFVCSVCQKSFRHKVNLMEHFQRKHSQVRPYICDVCAARFVTKQELVRHYRKHIGD